MRCRICKMVKDLDEFVRNKSRATGYEKRCLSCSRTYSRKQSGNIGSRYCVLRKSAQVRNIEVNITKDQYILLVDNQVCHYCSGNLPRTGAGLDRLDSSKGYNVGNVVPCCEQCNTIKADWLTHDEMIVVMKALLSYRRSRLPN